MTIIDSIFLKRLMIDIRLRQIFKIENHSKNLLSPPRRQPPTILASEESDGTEQIGICSYPYG